VPDLGGLRRLAFAERVEQPVLGVDLLPVAETGMVLNLCQQALELGLADRALAQMLELDLRKFAA
jgi:hypothetical protein